MKGCRRDAAPGYVRNKGETTVDGGGGSGGVVRAINTRGTIGFGHYRVYTNGTPFSNARCCLVKT